MSDDRSQLSKLARALLGCASSLIARAGRVVFGIARLRTPTTPPPRTGFLRGGSVPTNFDRMDAEKIQAMFEGCQSES